MEKVKEDYVCLAIYQTYIVKVLTYIDEIEIYSMYLIGGD
jgi:hypothetical protein